jgi:hypothetical protein
MFHNPLNGNALNALVSDRFEMRRRTRTATLPRRTAVRRVTGHIKEGGSLNYNFMNAHALCMARPHYRLGTKPLSPVPDTRPVPETIGPFAVSNRRSDTLGAARGLADR